MSEKASDPTKPTQDKEMPEKSARNGAQPPQKGDKAEDAITQLKNDHRKVEGLFETYKAEARDAEKQKLAQEICRELIVHAQIEEEIFYPACSTAAGDDMLDEAQVEHDSAKVLLAELIDGAPSDSYLDAKVKVLGELIKHYIQEEEKKHDSIFAKAKQAGVKTDEIAQRLAARKAELIAQAERNMLERPRPRSFTNSRENTMPQGQYRDRDERGRFTSHDDDNRRYSTRSSPSSRYDDDDDRRQRTPQCDDQGRFMSEDDDRRSSRYSRSRDDDDRGRRTPDRDQYGRFVSDADDDRRYGSRSRSRYEEDDDDRRYASSSRRSSSDRYDDDDRRGRRTGGWFGDSEGHSRAARAGWRNSDHDGSGWYGDPEGHSRAARSGWRNSDHDGSGWYGDSEGHAEAARRGWEGRSRDNGRENGGRYASRDDRDYERRSMRSRRNDDDDDDDRSSSRYRH